MGAVPPRPLHSGRDGSFMDLGVYAHRIDYKYDSKGYRLRETDW